MSPADSVPGVVAVTMPQVNVNDEEVILLGWHVPDGGQAVEGQPLCEVETSKSVGDMPSPASGIFRPIVEVGEVVAIGQTIGFLGPSLEAIEQHLAARPRVAEPSNAGSRGLETAVDATAGAIELARRHGVDLAQVGAPGRIRREDVERYLAEHPVPGCESTRPDGGELPPLLAPLVDHGPELSDHQWSVARHLTVTQSRLVNAFVNMDVDMTAAGRWLDARRQAGLVTGPIPFLLHAAVAAVRAVPPLASFRLGRKVFSYHTPAIAFTARSPDGRLFTPVVRSVDSQSLEDLARQCVALSMAVFRGQLKPADQLGACMTVSALADQPVRFHVGLQNAYQSAILTAGAVRQTATVRDGQLAVRAEMTLCLSYDHGLMDGWEAAAALDAARLALESLDV
ncbi:MAG TPA: 2-oxo acid dehydrogenase subunit E2 [Phycisphaerae bacterium]|nr:2-oxo acid dehydrogenase subunit E2 [Phycisphaerae bacterium]HRY70822.1 2-oxo acid dehydrogenase subunit E2 [Phycisphaerae bacterium]HSA28327.1 2-oxo acid dehydrogenase subunit E2 [Phycisphaerae bacterium]